jgi:hypothetical protein
MAEITEKIAETEKRSELTEKVQVSFPELNNHQI